MDDLERDELVVRVGNGRDEEQRGVSAVDDLGICSGAHESQLAASPSPVCAPLSSKHKRENTPLYSKKLHILVLRLKTSCVTSLTILAFCLAGSVWNHLARRTLPE